MAAHAHQRLRGWLREYMVHFRYKWCNYYVRMSKNVALYPHERFSRGFEWRAHSVGYRATFPSSSDGRRRHVGGIASELRKHPKHGLNKC